jgi:hypothetical protein
MEDRISAVNDTIKEVDTSVKENVKFKNIYSLYKIFRKSGKLLKDVIHSNRNRRR